MADHISELHDNQAYLHGVINPTTQMFTMKVRFGILPNLEYKNSYQLRQFTSFYTMFQATWAFTIMVSINVTLWHSIFNHNHLAAGNIRKYTSSIVGYDDLIK